MYSFFVCILFGFDGLAGGIVVSIEQFRIDFGTPFEGTYVVSAEWQLGWLAATLFGMILGGFLAASGVQYFGRRITLGISYIISIGGVCLQYYCKNPAEFFGSKLLTGLPMGVFLSVAPSYASEMAPLVVRGAITAGMNFAICFGQLLGYAVMRQASFYPDARQYRVLFATQWGFAAVALIFLPLFPE
jgi:MFS family permease